MRHDLRVRVFCGLAASLMVSGCGDRELRGRTSDSPDGRTYLIVADNNGGQCGPIMVDGERWPHALDSAGPIRPGLHRIACGTEVEITIDSGKTFSFDYWRP